MKKTLSGTEAYGKMFEKDCPASTKTYKPVSHTVSIVRLKTEIAKAGYLIEDEKYSVTNDGVIALATIMLNSKDPKSEYALSCTFVNSYSKQQAFKFTLGFYNKETKAVFGVRNSKRYGTECLEEGFIENLLKNNKDLENEFSEQVRVLKSTDFSDTDCNNLFGTLFFEREAFTTMQMNMVRKRIKSKESFVSTVGTTNSWNIYNICASAMNEAHPTDWIHYQELLNDVMHSVANIEEKTVLDHLDVSFKRLKPEVDITSITPSTIEVDHYAKTYVKSSTILM